MFGLSRRFGSLAAFSLLIVTAALLTVIGELSGEFARIRQLSSQQRMLADVTRGEFTLLANGVSFGFDVDGEGNDVLSVALSLNRTFGWHETIEPGTRIQRSEAFLLDKTEYSFSVDITVKSYDKETLEFVDNTEPIS